MLNQGVLTLLVNANLIMVLFSEEKYRYIFFLTLKS